MDDFDDKKLELLKNLQAPEARSDARARAVDAAVNAFEAEEKKISTVTQGSAAARRPISVFLNETWSWIMEKRVMAGAVAAGLLMLPVAYQVSREAGVPLMPGSMNEAARTDDRQAAASPPVTKPAPVVKRAEERETDGAALQPPVTVMADAPSGTDTRAPTPVAELAAQSGSATGTGGLYSGGAAQGAKLRRKQMASPLKMQNAAPADRLAVLPTQDDRDRFQSFETNPLKTVANDPVSTVSIDVDTASYAFVRRMLRNGRMPAPDAVRVEEMINYFPYDYPRPENAETPFRPTVAVYPTPWNKGTRLLHIGIKGHDIVPATRPRSNLVFLIDVSGSMQNADKLPLLKNAFRLLVNRLGENDSVSIVTYAGHAGTALEPTKGSERFKILNALDNLRSGGSTAGAQGIRQAYALAQQSFIEGGVNRVILATDGDFNVGMSSVEDLKRYIEEKRRSGIFLSVMGFGQGNYNDALMQALAQNGNGNAAYIDTLNEARKVLVEEASSTLFPIAKDVKIQVEFNPARVSEYRLIGYETRALRREDFNNDKVDAGDIGSGHTVTAIYEITPAGSESTLVDDLRYQQATKPAAPAAPVTAADEYAFLKLRYKLPDAETSKLVTVPVTVEHEVDSLSALDDDVRFAASVAAFGQKLRRTSFLDAYGYDDIVRLANGARGTDAFGYRAEFVNLVRLAASLGGQDTGGAARQ